MPLSPVISTVASAVGDAAIIAISSRIAALVPTIAGDRHVAIGDRAQPLDLAVERQVIERALERDASASSFTGLVRKS